MKAWKRIDPTKVTKVGWRTIVTKTFVMPDGKIDTFDTFHGEDAVFAGVIALTSDSQVIVARQFRPGPEKIMDELPGGAVNKGEEPCVGAIRELEEETGHTPGTIELLGVSGRSAFNNATWYYYLATDCAPTNHGQSLDSNEFVEVRLISIAELIDNAKKDRLTDPAAVLMAYDKLKEIAAEG